MAQAVITSSKSLIAGLSPERPVLIAGPTASGKSALALEIAAQQGGVIVNADASQVYRCWRVISARPSAAEEALAPHALYGHIDAEQSYSTGHWLREVIPLLKGDTRPIVVGGTGLYFSALTRGLADIPATPHHVRTEADALPLPHLLADLDAATKGTIDTANRARVQRAWEVLRATGRGLADWQATTKPPALPLDQAQAIVFDVSKDWLNARIEKRFDLMMAEGALEEVSKVLPTYDPSRPAHRAIGVPELIDHLAGRTTLEEARDRAVIATRQFAKRQRTWFRSKMGDWQKLSSAKAR
ncbi:tRNA (adenosine(37)-N6)-dimethylallyltransferase MiaA [uncultured Roseobacter sp.]|uniref:tRNA (adenosine(37)-N6)-dimethylallyltransferase MiaA n=1 Tax=uncultured Roseobacter sp. TaxID=114847 RepID=UPI00260BFC90|nr:tRNA (adenosine(37)-N6)-dimethylallyltransferase MiaA [uncultured Roseobacter sp.]